MSARGTCEPDVPGDVVVRPYVGVGTATSWTAVARAYRELLGSSARIDLISHRAGSACLTQVIRVSPNHRGDDAASRVIASLRAAGYEVQGSYVPIHLLSSFNACVWDRLPHTERLWTDLVELPCEPSVSMNDIERIAAIVKGTVSA